MSENQFFKRRADRLSRAEFEAIQVLKTAGWLVITDVEFRDGRPELGDGQPTYRFEGRQPIAIFKTERRFEIDDDTVEQVDETAADPEAKQKKRGRPKKQ